MAFTFLKKPIDPPSLAEVKTEVRTALAESEAIDNFVEGKQPPEVSYDEGDSESSIKNEDRKLSRLIDDDFPFDESQLNAVDGMVESQYACLTGAAGTGKTTTTKKLVDRLMETTTIGNVNMADYWAMDFADRQDAVVDSYEYEIPDSAIPTILMCAFTGRATQMIKKNFPRDWHGNIMTIHRALGFIPESYEAWDDDYTDHDTGEKGGYRTKMRFVPTYTADCLMPWDIILIDEAGMLGLDLWHQLLAACKPGARIYMIGDINQLPPVHGKSIFGFAMAKWPAYELTKVHRQQGVNNPIVDNAWRIIHGQMPQSEGNFTMIPLKGDAQYSSRQVRAMAPKLLELGAYDPIRDTIITPINGEHGSRGFPLGQMPLNEEFARIFNPKSANPRYIIDGGRERKQFAVGDKVMATRNDYESGITNGMTGIIISIHENEGYGGDKERFGILEEVNARFADDAAADVIGEFSLEDLDSTLLAIEDGKEQAKEKKDRGPASHTVTVRFGSDEHGFEIPFQTLAEVGSLMMAYVATCHKMQGGEAHTIIVICHDSHKHMLYREWLYTAVTRASERLILLYTESALKTALNKQTIKGRTLKEKVMSFNALMDPKGQFDWLKEVRLPHCESTALTIMDREETAVMTPARLTTDAELSGGVAALLRKSREAKPDPNPIHVTVVKETHIHVHASPNQTPPDVDGGSLTPVSPGRVAPREIRVPDSLMAPSQQLPPPPLVVSQWGAVHTLKKIEQQAEQLLLTYQPKPVESIEPKRSGLSFLVAKKESVV